MHYTNKSLVESPQISFLNVGKVNLAHLSLGVN